MIVGSTSQLGKPSCDNPSSAQTGSDTDKTTAHAIRVLHWVSKTRIRSKNYVLGFEEKISKRNEVQIWVNTNLNQGA